MGDINQYMIWMIIIFSLGYLLIAFEHLIDVNKATSALMMGVLLWVLQFANHGISNKENLKYLCEHLSNASQVIVFLLGALIIVEIINAQKGFKILTDYMKIRSKRKMLWVIGILTFFLSSILDNLTTTIVMISIMQKIIDDPDDRMLIGGGVVVFVPIFKQFTGLPPFMGIIFGLSILWFFTDLAHRKKHDRDYLRVTSVLSKVDISGPLFFLGILLAINALETGGILSKLAVYINENISNTTTIATSIGLVSAVVDNIPLVAASMGMYDVS